MAASAPAINLGEPLTSPPDDGISSMRFAPTSDLLLATSWDQVGITDRSTSANTPVLEVHWNCSICVDQEAEFVPCLPPIAPLCVQAEFYFN